MIKVLFFIPWLGGGGAERTFLNIINNLDRNEFEPVLALCRRKGSYLDLLRKDVEIIHLNIRLRFAAIPLALKIRKYKPDIVISTMRFANLVSVIAAKLSGRKTRLIVRETNNLSAAGIKVHGPVERLAGWSYRRAGKVVSLSNGVKSDMLNRYGLAPDHIKTIFNPVDIAQVRRLAAQKPEGNPFAPDNNGKVFNVIGVGKLHYQKGFDILIKAVSGLRDLPVRLTILGEGSERENLLHLVRELKLNDRVSLPGFMDNPYAFMARADLFVLSSRWEGFGHVIAEAMACGVAVLSTRCPSGPDEIITDQMDGRLCMPDSVDDLALCMKQLLQDDKCRRRYVTSGLESVKRFEVNKIVKQYERSFRELAC